MRENSDAWEFDALLSDAFYGDVPNSRESGSKETSHAVARATSTMYLSAAMSRRAGTARSSGLAEVWVCIA